MSIDGFIRSNKIQQDEVIVSTTPKDKLNFHIYVQNTKILFSVRE